MSYNRPAGELLRLDAEKAIADYRIKFRKHSDSFWLRFWGKLIKPFNPNFSKSMVVTLGRTIHLPEGIDSLWLDHLPTLIHEIQHVKDWTRHPILFPLTYVTQFGRWHWEKRGYSEGIRAAILLGRDRDKEIERAVASLKRAYFLPFISADRMRDYFFDKTLDAPRIV